MYAADPESYHKFAPLFDKILEDYHGFKPGDTQPAVDLGEGKVGEFEPLDPKGKYIKSIRFAYSFSSFCCGKFRGSGELVDDFVTVTKKVSTRCWVFAVWTTPAVQFVDAVLLHFYGASQPGITKLLRFWLLCMGHILTCLAECPNLFIDWFGLRGESFILLLIYGVPKVTAAVNEIFCRIRCARSIAGYPFNPLLSADDYMILEQKVNFIPFITNLSSDCFLCRPLACSRQNELLNTLFSKLQHSLFNIQRTINTPICFCSRVVIGH